MKTLALFNPKAYKHVHCFHSVHRVQFVPRSPCVHLRTAFMRVPGVGSNLTAIILQREVGGEGCIGTRHKQRMRKRKKGKQKNTKKQTIPKVGRMKEGKEREVECEKGATKRQRPVIEADVRGMQLQLRTCIKTSSSQQHMNPGQCVLGLTKRTQVKL